MLILSQEPFLVISNFGQISTRHRGSPVLVIFAAKTDGTYFLTVVEGTDYIYRPILCSTSQYSLYQGSVSEYCSLDKISYWRKIFNSIMVLAISFEVSVRDPLKQLIRNSTSGRTCQSYIVHRGYLPNNISQSCLVLRIINMDNWSVIHENFCGKIKSLKIDLEKKSCAVQA